MTCFFAAMNFLSRRKRYPGGMAKQVQPHYGRMNFRISAYPVMAGCWQRQDNLFIVGDDDQSIYHFRGAKPEIMLNFTKDYPKAETVLLDINYRCTKNVLQAAMNVVGCNQIRFKKRLSTPNEQGKPVKVMEFDNPREEYVKIAAFLKKRLEAGENLEDTAVLFRTNQEAEGLVGALMEYQIPFTMKEQLL